jgi:membrane-associated phospholipid phosphatase
MVADGRTTPDARIGARLDAVSARVRRPRLLTRATSIPVLALAMIASIVLAAGPMQGLDEKLDRHWLFHMAPQLLPLVQGVLDRIAGQAVCLPVLAAVAITVAVRRRSWRPIGVGVMTELAFLIGVGGMKILIARPSPTLDNADLLAGGIQNYGEKGISFPSGHASEAVLMFGAAAYLIIRYTDVSVRVQRILCGVVALITLNSVVTSLLLGWHWASDLLGGVIAGALFLRIVIWWDQRRGTAQADEPADSPAPVAAARSDRAATGSGHASD